MLPRSHRYGVKYNLRSHEHYPEKLLGMRLNREAVLQCFSRTGVYRRSQAIHCASLSIKNRAPAIATIRLSPYFRMGGGCLQHRDCRSRRDSAPFVRPVRIVA